MSAAAPGPVPDPVSGPGSVGRLDGPRVTDRFVNQPTAAELEEARRALSSPQVLARVSPLLRNRVAPPAPAPSAAGSRPPPRCLF